MVPQLQFRARAALVFGELHDSIRMDRVRGISYHSPKTLTFYVTRLVQAGDIVADTSLEVPRGHFL
jgi:hypothetical protein